MRTSFAGEAAEFQATNYSTLALFVPLIERMKLESIIDRHLPVDDQAEFSLGKILTLLIAARLHYPMALSNVSDWAEQSGAEFVWGIPHDKLNDDRLGRALDDFFTQRHSICAAVALHIAQEFNIPLSELHYDPTHISFTGSYEDAQPRVGVVDGERIRSDDQLPAAQITKGRGTDDTPPGTLLVHAGLCVHVDEFGPLPLLGHTVDGNRNGHTAVAEQMALLQKHLRPPRLTLISDSGTYSVVHLSRLQAENYHAICSAPWDEFRELFDQRRDTLTWQRANFLSIEQQRRRQANSSLPHEYYNLAEVSHTLHDQQQTRDVPCRVLFVYSSADQKVVEQQRAKHLAKLQAGLEKLQKSVAAGNASTDPASVARRIGALFGTKQAASFFHWEMVPLTAAEQQALPPRGRGCKRPTHRLEFRLDTAQVASVASYDGYSVLVTTVPASQASADALFTKLKEQNYSEHVNSRFKGPLQVRPVYLHRPERVEALVFLLMIALTVYFLLQRLYRQNPPTTREWRMTTELLQRAFANYGLLLQQGSDQTRVYASRLTSRQREILAALQFFTPTQILSQRMSHPP